MPAADDAIDLIEKGAAPDSVPMPVRLEGKKLKEFLVNQGILHKKAGSDELKERVGVFLKDGSITVDAFYFTKDGPLLLLFEVAMSSTTAGQEIGIVRSLTGDSDLEQLFKFTSAKARIVRCTRTTYGALQRYAAKLASQNRDG